MLAPITSLSPAHRSPKYNRGFTLVEGMIVVALIGVLSVVSIPSLKTASQKTKVRTSAEIIKQGLVFAREQAMSRSHKVQFILTDDTNLTGLSPNATIIGRHWVAITLADPDIIGDIAENIGGEKITPTENTAITVSGPASLTFSAIGKPLALTLNSAAPTYSILVNGTLAYQVKVSTGGKIQACDPTPAATSNPC